jgi:opacity protein-like surface antigen
MRISAVLILYVLVSAGSLFSAPISAQSLQHADDSTAVRDTLNADSLYAKIYFDDAGDFTTDSFLADRDADKSILGGVFMMLFIGASLGIVQNNNPE